MGHDWKRISPPAALIGLWGAFEDPEWRCSYVARQMNKLVTSIASMNNMGR
jgi:hypothetical protein